MCDFSELSQLVGECEGKLLRYAEHFLHDSASARDAVQDAYVRYIRFRKKNAADRPVANLSAWIFKATRNICLDILKSARVRTEVPFDEAETGFISFSAPDREAVRADDLREIRKLVTELSPREQELLTLKFEQSKRYDEIAEIMGLTVGNVGFLLHGAIRKLRSAALRGGVK